MLMFPNEALETLVLKAADEDFLKMYAGEKKIMVDSLVDYAITDACYVSVCSICIQHKNLNNFLTTNNFNVYNCFKVLINLTRSYPRLWLF